MSSSMAASAFVVPAAGGFGFLLGVAVPAFALRSKILLGVAAEEEGEESGGGRTRVAGAASESEEQNFQLEKSSELEIFDQK